MDLAGNGAEAVLQAVTHRPDAIILDVLMPHLDGLEACRSLRMVGSRAPILILTARDGVRDRVDGLDAGADDFVGKPFALEELLARLRALLRRSAHGPAESGLGTVGYADVVLNPATREAFRAGRPLALTRTEFDLLAVFLSRPEQVLTRDRLFDAVWGYEPVRRDGYSDTWRSSSGAAAAHACGEQECGYGTGPWPRSRARPVMTSGSRPSV